MPAEPVQAFFDTARGMNFYDDQSTTVGELFERFFPGREDVIRLLMEPITYANGSTLEDPGDLATASCSRTSCRRACSRSRGAPIG